MEIYAPKGIRSEWREEPHFPSLHLQIEYFLSSTFDILNFNSIFLSISLRDMFRMLRKRRRKFTCRSEAAKSIDDVRREQKKRERKKYISINNDATCSNSVEDAEDDAVGNEGKGTWQRREKSLAFYSLRSLIFMAFSFIGLIFHARKNVFGSLEFVSKRENFAGKSEEVKLITEIWYHFSSVQFTFVFSRCFCWLCVCPFDWTAKFNLERIPLLWSPQSPTINSSSHDMTGDSPHDASSDSFSI